MNADSFLRTMELNFKESRLILVERVISSFLEGVANDPKLYEILVESNRGFDYQCELQKAIVRERYSARFSLPQNRHVLVALVTGILYEFDKKTRSLVDFVTKYYPSDGSHQSYLKFLDGVIFPYIKAFRELLNPVAPEPERQEANSQPLPDQAKEDAEQWAKCLLKKVIADNEPDESDRNEMTTMIHGFLYVLDTHNPLLIKIVWIGLKNTFGNYQQGFTELKALEAVLLDYGVLS